MAADLTLFLMTEKGYRVLDRLGEQYADRIECVVGAADSEVQNDYNREIKSLCSQLGISYFDRKDFGALTSRFALAVSWRWLIASDSTLLVVFHDSLLPKYRGFSPLVSALINGEQEIGVSAILASDEYDRGEVAFQSRVAVQYPLKIKNAIEMLSQLYGDVAEAVVGKLLTDGALQTQSQSEGDASYSLWRDAEDYRIDWQDSAEKIQRFVDAVGFPYQGAQTLAGDVLARVLDSEVVEDVAIENRVPGKVIFVQHGCPVIVCGKGLLRVKGLEDADSGESLLPLPRFRTRFS
ncbi:MAG: formyltransferase family protein [Woeseiaceae bacterium]